MEPLPHFEEIDFQKLLQVLQRRWMPAVGVFGAVASVASVYAFSLKPTYQAEANLLMSTNQASSLTGVGEAVGRLRSLEGTDSSPLDTQVQIVTSSPVIQETIRTLNLKDSKGKFLKTFPGQLKVKPVKGTDVMQISYTDEDPQLTAKVVNNLTQVYIRRNIEANRAEAVSARKFIVQQLPGTEEAVRKAESDLRKFKEQNSIISLPEEASAAVNGTSRLEDQISQTQAQLDKQTAQSQKLQKQAAIDSQQDITSASLSQIPGIQQALAQRQEAQSQLAVAQTRFQPGHPTVLNLEDRIAALDRLLQQRMQDGMSSHEQADMGNLQIGQLRQQLIENFARSEVERVGLERQINTLSNKLSAYKERANVLPKLEQAQRQLERRLKASQTTYEALLHRLQEVQVLENQNIGNVRVIAPALIPEAPTASRNKIIIVGGAVTGALLGVVAAFALDAIDRSVKTVKEAKELLQYTLLGVIPSVSKSGKKSSSERGEQPISRVIGIDLPQFPIGDAYQMLQANLKFLSSDKQLKAIVVTSSVSQEGKSEVAANLAVAMAQVGRRVLLVDANMRHPVQHHIWGMTNVVGLSNIIVDQVPLNKSLQKVLPNLHVIPSGVVPPNPVALLDSKRMAALVALFTEKYDFVIFDTPALAGKADAAVLGQLTDGILLVVRPGVVNSASAKAAKEFLKQSSQQVLGMVINGVNVKREPDSYFYYTQEQLEPSSMSRNSVIAKQNLLGDTGRRGT
ncbi:MAG: polysaccharide biosynthesis tyrosine autokinase [Stigonema ocellatum SAG 48.90 = DSM 106950]|nr:polysaccharide biosynthesis tyrosine autokinase [Stigonema ocellatum SAG 48.90 = DSM 106950]